MHPSEASYVAGAKYGKQAAKRGYDSHEAESHMHSFIAGWDDREAFRDGFWNAYHKNA